MINCCCMVAVFEMTKPERYGQVVLLLAEIPRLAIVQLKKAVAPQDEFIYVELVDSVEFIDPRAAN